MVKNSVGDIEHNLAVLRQRVKQACERVGRNPEEVQILLATKTVEANRILEAFEEGATLIGENRAQELVEKFDALKVVAHTTHFIGHLQSNKLKDVVGRVDCVQSLDRLDLAEKIEKRLAAEGREIDVLIQVKTAPEESKFGCAPKEALALTKAVSALPHLHVKGLMTIGVFSENTEEVRACFRKLMSVRQEIITAHIDGVSMDVVSMGMSGDLELAIEEGSTLIRVGTAVFGKRL